MVICSSKPDRHLWVYLLSHSNWEQVTSYFTTRHCHQPWQDSKVMLQYGLAVSLDFLPMLVSHIYWEASSNSMFLCSLPSTKSSVKALIRLRRQAGPRLGSTLQRVFYYQLLLIHQSPCHGLRTVLHFISCHPHKKLTMEIWLPLFHVEKVRLLRKGTDSAKTPQLVSIQVWI